MNLWPDWIAISMSSFSTEFAMPGPWVWHIPGAQSGQMGELATEKRI